MRGTVDGGTAPGEDGSVAMRDGAAPSDGSVPIADSATPPTACEPTSGSDALAGYCQQVMISVLRRDGLPTSVEARGIMTSVGDGCHVVDRVELRSRDGVIQTLIGETPSYDLGTAVFVARADEAATELSALCAGDDGRYDPFEVVAYGRMDGGTFEAHCGADLGGGFGWPPSSAITCHHNLPVGPMFMGGAEVQALSGASWSSIWLSYPNDHGVSIDSIGSDIQIIPTADPFAGGFFDPISSSGWDTSVSYSTSAHELLGVQLNLLEDGFGPELCPVPDTTGEPTDTFPPVLLLKLTGAGAGGPFETEAYLYGCDRRVM